MGSRTRVPIRLSPDEEKAFSDPETAEIPGANHFFFENVAGKMIPEIRAFRIAGSNGGGRRGLAR